MCHVTFCGFSSPSHAQLHHLCSPTQWHAFKSMPLCWVVSLALQHEKCAQSGTFFMLGCLPTPPQQPNMKNTSNQAHFSCWVAFHPTPATQYEKCVQSGMFSLLDCLHFQCNDRMTALSPFFIFFDTTRGFCLLDAVFLMQQGDCLLVTVFGVLYFSTVPTVLGKLDEINTYLYRILYLLYFKLKLLKPPNG